MHLDRLRQLYELEKKSLPLHLCCVLCYRGDALRESPARLLLRDDGKSEHQ